MALPFGAKVRRLQQTPSERIWFASCSLTAALGSPRREINHFYKPKVAAGVERFGYARQGHDFIGLKSAVRDRESQGDQYTNDNFKGTSTR